MKHKNTPWVDLYRPRKIEDCVIPPDIKTTFMSYLKNKRLNQHLLLCGNAGVGKTAVAKALCDELEAELLFINASLKGNIDTLRDEIVGFASRISMTGKQKIVILDEADGLNANSTQLALRATMEQFSSNCTFILTCNFKNKIIDAIQSRCVPINFLYNKKDLLFVQGQFFKRIKGILNEEEVEYEDKAIGSLIKTYGCDFRIILNIIQRHATKSNSITTEILSSMDVSIDDLMKHLKERSWNSIRQWVSQNADIDIPILIRKIYDGFDGYLKNESKPQIILILNETQYKSSFVADKEILMVACLTEIMAEGEFL